ncbi:dual specificity protein phosphatase 8 [Plakobranchus ocellatus]|uniref:protein-tyrosine-phosphatase n=1 Tax=Plakobranchus ocellatus TaxID=259542 RepID=A0AAV3XYJ0_9GAST|nr:dual specificity protein phosphatase 8 [Plakobranchus ocellatus]
MVIDSRSFLEYNTSNVQQSVNVCCSKLVKRRLQQDKVHVLDLLHQTCNVGADETWDVVVYDQCTEDPSLLTPDNFVQVLLHKLSTTFNSVAFLKGGFLAFHASHPSLTESKSCTHRCSTLTSLSQPCMPVSNVGPTRILPFLYLGSQQDSLNQELAQVNGISYILNVSKTCPCPSYIQENHFHRIPVNDNYCEKLLPHFEEAFQFLDKVREANGCVLVHCLGGVSRSATLTIAYIMKHMRMSSDEAYRYVKDKRPTISPNFNFLGQLIEFEKLLHQEAAEEERRRIAARCLSSPATSASEECGSSTSAIMDLHSTVTTSPSSPGPKMMVNQAVSSAQNLQPSKLASPQNSSLIVSENSDLETSSALISQRAASGNCFQLQPNAAAKDCPFPGPDSIDLTAAKLSGSACSVEHPGAYQLPVEAKEEEQLLLRHKRHGSSRRSGLRPTSAPTPYTIFHDSVHLPGPLLQHRHLFEAALRQDVRSNKDFSPEEETSAGADSQHHGLLPCDMPAQSPVCPLTGFPSPGLLHEDLPQSTCPVVTGFPGPQTLDSDIGCIPNSSTKTSTTSTIPGPELQARATYQDRPESIFLSPPKDLDVIIQNISEGCSSASDSPDPRTDTPTAPSKSLLKNQQQSQQQQHLPNKRFSFSSMFSGFRWRTRPPTLPLSSPVGSMKKHGSDSGIVDSRNQLTPVSEAIENCDLNPSEATASSASGSDSLISASRAPSEPILMGDDNLVEGAEAPNVIGSSTKRFNASSQTSGYSSLPLSFSTPSLATSSCDDDMNICTSSSDNSSTIGKPGSLRLHARSFTLSLSSPTSNFPVKFSPSTVPSPSDSTNKRKSFLPSSSNSPDKLAKTDTVVPHAQPQAAISAATPPKTLNLAQSTMGKLKQRLSGKKSMALPISSPTAAMAKLNFASPSAEQPASPLLPEARHQNQGDIRSPETHSHQQTSAGDDAAKMGSNVSSDDHRLFRKGKGHKKDGSKSLFLRKSRWSEEKAASKADAAQKRAEATLTSSVLLASFSSGSSMSSSSASSKMSLSLSSSTMSSSTYSDMSSSSISSSPPPFPPSSFSHHSASPVAAAAATASSFHLQGLSEFPTTSLDKLNFTPCYTKDIVQELKQRETARKMSGSGPIPAGDSSSGPSALDSPMSISSGSSAPSVASSTLSPVDASLANPFSEAAVQYPGMMESLAAYPLPQSPPLAGSLNDQEEDDDLSALPSYTGSPGVEAVMAADLNPTSPSDFDPLSPSSLPQATMAPTLPTTPSSFYCSSSSIEPLSPMSLSDNSSNNSPIRSPTRQLHHRPSSHHQHNGWAQELTLVASSTSCVSSPASSLSFTGLSASSGGGASSSISSSITSPLSSLSQLSSASSVSSTTKVVLRRNRGSRGDRKSGSGGSNGSIKHVILDRPNSIAFSHYPTCDLVAQTPPPSKASTVGVESMDTAAPNPSSLDDACEVYMSSARQMTRCSHRHRQPSVQESFLRQGRTSWGGYSEREVYRQITAAMETAMLRTQAYSRRLGLGGGRLYGSRSHSDSRKARSLDDILDSSSSDVEFISGRRSGAGGVRHYSGGTAYTAQKEPYHCGMLSGSEPYHSNSSLSSNGSHGSSLEIIQVS